MSRRQELGRAARSIFEAGLAAVDPQAAVTSALSISDTVLEFRDVSNRSVRLDLDSFERVLVVGAGKAGAKMGAAVERCLGGRVSGGLVVVKRGSALEGCASPSKRIEIVEAGHPVPDEAGQAAARRLAALLARADAGTLVIFLVSGGASALLPAPAGAISLSDKRALTEKLLAAGADIRAINTVRRHVSVLKGGQAARLAHPARVVSLLLSDVVGDSPGAIGSGPTVADPTTFSDAWTLLERFALLTDVAPAIRAHLEAGIAGQLADTPAPGDTKLAETVNLVIGSNRLALEAAAAAAQRAGWRTLLLSSSIEGEAEEVARVYAALAREALATQQPVPTPACLLAGGETTVTLRGRGKGGRNQQLALAAALALEDLDGAAIFSAGTDGDDGPTDAAGAIAFGDTVARGAACGLSAQRHLLDNNAYPFFAALDDLVVTGPTGTNVMDLHLVLVAPSEIPGV